jgi:hypothetical protein
MTATARLNTALLTLAVRGERSRCADPVTNALWTSEHQQDRDIAITWCQGCPCSSSATTQPSNAKRHGGFGDRRISASDPAGRSGEQRDQPSRHQRPRRLRRQALGPPQKTGCARRLRSCRLLAMRQSHPARNAVGPRPRRPRSQHLPGHRARRCNRSSAASRGNRMRGKRQRQRIIRIFDTSRDW